MEITTKQLKKMWLNYFQEKGHKLIKNSSLIPENDASVLFTTAGMQPLVPYLLGESHPSGKMLCNVQRCVRTNDILEVGDNTHCTFFEMLGNWSLGAYFKEVAIKNSFEFLTSNKYLNFPVDRIAVTVFKGNENAPKDEESYELWKKCGILEKNIFYESAESNWWAAGSTGPCGPDTEMFYITDKEPCSEKCSPSCDCGRYVEIWNNVFMQYVVKTEGGKVEPLSQKNVDTGMGLERTVSKLNGFSSVFEIDTLKPVVNYISSKAIKKYGESEIATKNIRIITDHIRSSTFIMGDENGISPSNTGQGYVLRRLIRRSVNSAKTIGLNNEELINIAGMFIEIYSEDYPILLERKDFVLTELKKEINKFNNTINSGLKELKKLTNSLTGNVIDGKSAFRLYDTFGFPIELTKEIAGELGFSIDEEGFQKAYKEHQALSKSTSEQSFKGGLSGTGVQETRYHTCTHLLLASLREMFGNNIFQRGSNITPERMRFDFNFDRKLTDEEKKTLEDKVNYYISQAIPVKKELLSLEDARNSGALGIFDSKYGDIVSVYTIGNVSKEICGGPHVENTKELGKFKIIKEESSSSGIRRIKAVLE